MDVLKKARIIPKIVDVVSSANIRAFENNLSDKKDEEQESSIIDIILSIGASNTISYSGGEKSFKIYPRYFSGRK